MTTEHTPGPWQQIGNSSSLPIPTASTRTSTSPRSRGRQRRADRVARTASGQRPPDRRRSDLLAACRMVVARWERGDLAEAARACQRRNRQRRRTPRTRPEPSPSRCSCSTPITRTTAARRPITPSSRRPTRSRPSPGQTASGRRPGGYRHRAGRFRPAAGDPRSPLQRAAVQQVTQPPTEKGISHDTIHRAYLPRNAAQLRGHRGGHAGSRRRHRPRQADRRRRQYRGMRRREPLRPGRSGRRRGIQPVRDLDFEAERIRKAAPKLLDAVERGIASAESGLTLDKRKTAGKFVADGLEAIRQAVDEAKSAGISPAADIDVHAFLAERRQIALIWSIEDVQGIRPDLGDEQGWEVLQNVDQ